MSAFRALVASQTPTKKARAPSDFATLLPGHYADTWPKKPTTAHQVGLRTVSEADLQTARSEAAKRAWESFPEPDQDDDERIDCFNDALAAWIVAKGTTSAEDVAKPWLDMAADNVQVALTSPGLHFLIDSLMALAVERSPLSPEAADGDLVKLCEALTTGAVWSSVDGPAARRARRHLHRAMALLALG